MNPSKPSFARIAFFASLASLLWGTAIDAKAQTFSDRARAAYENLTPSQRQESLEQMSRDGVLSPRHKALTTTGQGGTGNLVFMKGLNCTEWMLNEKIVRKSWLNQYFDVTQSKDAIPIKSNDDSALNVVDDYCFKNATAPVENAFAAAFRRAEAALLLNREESRKRAEEARKNAEEDRRKQEAESRAKSVAAATEEFRKENNPSFSPTTLEISCDAWRKKPTNLRLSWLKQYLAEINVTDDEFVKKQESRLQRFCLDHPDATASAAHGLIVGSAGGSQERKETAQTTNTANGQSDAKISWRSKLHSNGANITGVSINGTSYGDATPYVSIRPGFNRVDYTCVWANGKSRQGTLDFIAKGNGEYSMTTVSHHEGVMPKIAKMDHHIPYRSDLTRPSENDCSAQLFECTGYLYTSQKRLTQSCITKKPGFLSMLNDKDGYSAVIE